MATIHQAPGVNETARNLAVAPNAPAVGAQATRTAAVVTVVAYSQSEPGDGHNPQRS